MKEEKFDITVDGIKIACFMATPDNPIGTIVSVPGFMGKLVNKTDTVKEFASLGFKALAFEYAGTIGGVSGGEPRGPKLTRDIKTLKAVLDFLKEDVFVYTNSWGGRVTFNVAANDKRIQAISAFAPVIDFKRYVDGDLKDIEGYPLTDDFKDDFKSYDIFKDAEKIECPVSITHGNDDKIVPIGPSKKVFERLRCKKEFIELEGVGHGDKVPDEEWEKFKDRSIAWFKKFL